MDRTAYKNQHCREHYDRIYLTIPKRGKDRIKATAAALGVSVNEYLYALVCDDMAAGWGKRSRDLTTNKRECWRSGRCPGSTTI